MCLGHELSSSKARVPLFNRVGFQYTVQDFSGRLATLYLSRLPRLFESKLNWVIEMFRVIVSAHSQTISMYPVGGGWLKWEYSEEALRGVSGYSRKLPILRRLWLYIGGMIISTPSPLRGSTTGRPSESPPRGTKGNRLFFSLLS